MMRTFDWAATPLGPQAAWPQTLRTVTRLVLQHPFAMVVLWGPELIQVYNDAYRVIMGDRHPAGLGQPTRECWPDVWAFTAPVYEGVMTRGETFEFTDRRLVISRGGQEEEAFFTLTYSPVPDEAGAVAGVLVTVIETSERVRAQADVQFRIQKAEVETRAQEAFTAFTEAVGSQIDVLALSQEAIRVLRARFRPDSTFVFYERESDHWRARVWSEDLEAQPELLAVLRDGLPLDTPLYAEGLRTGHPVFTEEWNAEREQVPHSEHYGAAANVPLVVDGEVCGFVALGLRHTHRWSELDKGVVRAVGRGLNLALERGMKARQLQQQKDTAERQKQVLDAFAHLTQELAPDAAPIDLIRQVQEVVLRLLPDGFSLYYDREGAGWRLRSRVGQPTTPTLQAAPHVPLTTPSLLTPWQTGELYLQDGDDLSADELASPTQSPRTAVALPITLSGRRRGVLSFALMDGRRWTRTERAMFETVARSLNLALERTETTAELVTQRRSLEVATEELEAFTYSVSHDLRTPVRHIIGFNNLLRRELGEDVTPKVARYLTVVEEAAGRMNTLIDAMLNLSRASRLPLQLGPVDLNAMVGSVRTELELDLLGREVTWQVGALPLVMGDHNTLRQVITNVLDNALKYSRTRSPAQVDIWAEERAREWVIHVRDNGVGFDPQYAHKLFGVFQRLHRAQDFEGSGVGLANVRRIITRHGGQVWAEGRPGEGATFSFSLPKPTGTSLLEP